MCICFLGGACQNILPNVGCHRLPKKEKEKKKWIKILCPCITAEEMVKMLALTEKDGAVVDRRHFPIASLKIPFKCSGRVTLRNNVLPTRTHVPLTCQYNEDSVNALDPLVPDRKDVLLQKGKFRQILIDGGINPVLELVDNMVIHTMSIMPAVPQSMQKEATTLQSSHDTNFSIRTKNIIRDMKETPAYCQSMTGEPSFAVLQAIWDWIDADKAFSTMHLDRITHRKKPTVGAFDFAKMTIAQLTQEKIRVSGLVEEHKHCDLQPFDQFVLFMILFHRGYDGFVDTIALDYQITTGTARRYYDAFMCGLSFFSLHMQPNPTCDEMVHATPAEVSELINASATQGTHGVVMSDCTERRIQAPGLCVFFHFLFSAYKNRTTVKHLTVTSANGLLHLVGTFAPIDDADCIRIHGVAQRLGQALKFINDNTTRAKKYILTFVYDKGLDSYSEFIRNCVRVVLPDKKLNHQQVFKQSTSEKDTRVAKVRNLIENINADLKQYRGFNRELPLSRIDMAAHEVNLPYKSYV